MTPDDPRHGTTRGYHAGCHDACCRRAIADDERRRRLDLLYNGGRAVPAIGVQRRIQALMRLGWTSQDITDAAGWGARNRVLTILNGQKGKPTVWVQRKTYDTICRVYAELSMRLPVMERHRARTRTIATNKGFAPPLAWDLIDDPDERPKGIAATTRVSRTDVDAAIVARVLAGERLPMTTGERRAVVAKAIRLGWSELEIEARTGITQARSRRYQQGDAA